MTCDPIRWLWGLIPIAMLAWIAVHKHSDAIESDLEARSARALAAAGHGWASVAFSGRNGLLVGTAERPEDPPKALAVVDGVWGVYTVAARVRIAGDGERGAPPTPEPPVAKGAESAKEPEAPAIETAVPPRRELPPLTDDVAVLAGDKDGLPDAPPSVLAGMEFGPAALAEPTIDQVAANSPATVRENAAPAELAVAEAAAEVPAGDAAVADTSPSAEAAAVADAAGDAQPTQVYGPPAATLDPADAGPEISTAAAPEPADDLATAKATEPSPRAEPNRRDAPAEPVTVQPAPVLPAEDSEPEAERGLATPASEPSASVADAAGPAQRPGDASADEVNTETVAADAGQSEPVHREQETAAIAPETEGAATGPQEAAQEASSRCSQDTELAKISGSVRFARGKADLDRRDREVLDKIYSALNGCPELSLKVVGHTDADGAARRNMRLSLRRAKAAVTYLVDKGIDAGRLEAVGYGETRPVVPNDTADNRAKNRRVEVEVTGLEQSAEPSASEKTGDD